MTRAQEQQREAAIQAVTEISAGLPFDVLAQAFLSVLEERPDADPQTLHDLGNRIGRLADQIERNAA